MAIYDYMTVSYARPQTGGTTNNPMVSDTAKEVLNPVGTTSGSSIWGDLGRIGDIISGGGIINGSFVDRIFGRGTTSSSNSIWGDLGNIAGNYESALREAEAILGPQYQRAREQTMSEVDRNIVSRGFYGQAPGDAIRASTLTDLDMAYQAALGNYATNIMDRRAQMELQKYMFEKEMEEQRKQSKDRKKSSFWSGLGTALGGLFGGPAGAAIGTGIEKILNNIFS